MPELRLSIQPLLSSFVYGAWLSSLMFTYFPPHETSPGTDSKWMIIQIFISASLLVIWTYLMPIKTCSDYKIIHPFQFLIRLRTVTSKSFSSTNLHNVLKGRIKSPSYSRKERRASTKLSKLSISFLCPKWNINTSCILQFLYTQIIFLLEMQLWVLNKRPLLCLQFLTLFTLPFPPSAVQWDRFVKEGDHSEYSNKAEIKLEFLKSPSVPSVKPDTSVTDQLWALKI